MPMKKRLFLLDIDGTICRGNALIPGAGEFLQAVRCSGGQFVFITNNATRSTADYIRFFRTLGVESGPENYLTAAYATIRYMQEHYAGQHIYILATDSFTAECRQNGLQVTTDAADPAITCVLVSYDNALNYDKIKDVCLLLTTRQVDYIATNPDLVCPVDFGYLPDCGAICNMIETATHRRPRFLGKPEPAMVQYALQNAGCAPEKALVVGDRLYTDIACGRRAGVETALVLSGEATRADVYDSEEKPDYIFPSVAELRQEFLPEPAVSCVRNTAPETSMRACVS